MQFCDKCHNLFYIKLESSDSNNLVHYCKQCGNEDSTITCNIIQSVYEKQNPDIINEYTKFDPTLPRINNIPCPNQDCLTNTNSDTDREVIYIKHDEKNLKFIYLCTTCDTSWKLN